MNAERVRKTLEAIIEHQDYSLRIDNSDKDPLIELINTVLEEAEKRGEKNDQHKTSLKDQVTVRTADLEKNNQQLALDKREDETSSLSKSVFLANLSHELRTPLNHIIGYCEMIQEELEEEGLDHLVTDLSKIQLASDQLMKWVEEIIDLSKIESGRSELDHEVFPVSDLVGKVVERVRPLADKSGNTLAVSLPDSLGDLKGDQERLERVLFNLLENAVSENGKISLEARRETVGETDWLTFVVQDTGAGIDPKILENLFKSYTEAVETLSSGYGADALMLAITHRLVLVMGGHLNGESELGTGSTFTLRFPADMESHLKKPHVVKATNLFIRDILNLK